MHVHTHTHQAARQRAFVGIAAGHEGGMGSACAHGHAQALRGSHHDVGTHLARGLEQGEGQQVGGHDEGGGLCVALGCVATEVFHQPGAAGVLHQRSKVLCVQRSGEGVGALRHQHLNAQGLGTRLDHLDGLRMASA